jgi:predicted transcriptional regulator
MNLVSGNMLPVSRTDWTFLSNHGHVLLAIGQDPTVRIRDVADRVGITERSAQQILNDLVADGYVLRTRTGRRNTYELSPGMPFRHPLEDGQTVDGLLALFGAVPATR